MGPSRESEKDEPVVGKGNVALGEFKDSRGLPERLLGQIQGLPGGERKKIEASVPVSEIVATTFGEGLKTRGMAAIKKSPTWTLSGEIREFSCDQVALAGSSVDIVVKLTKKGMERASFTKSFTAEKTAKAAGDGGRELQQLAADTLQEAVDRALMDAELIQVASGE